MPAADLVLQALSNGAQPDAQQPQQAPVPAPDDSAAQPNSPALTPAPTPTPAPSVQDAQKAMQPGSFGHKLATALAVAHSVLSAGMTGLGDAAHATDNLKPGQGGLAGAENVLAARQTRITEQQRYDQKQQQEAQARQDKVSQQDIENKREADRTAALVASSNAQMTHETAATEQLGAESMQRVAKSDLDTFNNVTNADQPVPAQVIQRDITEGNLKNLIQSGKINGHEYTAYRTGVRTVGTDALTGQPKQEYTYSVTDIPKSYTIPDTDKGKSEAAKWSTVPGYESVKPGQTVTGAQANWLNQQANNIAIGDEVRKTALTKAKLETDESAKQLEANQFTGNPDWINAIAQNGGNIVKAAQAMVTNQSMRTKYPNLLNDIYSQFASNKTATDGPQRFEQIRHDQETEANAKAKTAALNVDQVGGIITDDMKRQIASLPDQVQDGIKKLDPSTQGALLAVAFGPGDYDFTKIFQRKYKGQTLLSPQEAIGWIKAINPNWTEQDYGNLQRAYKSIAPGTKTSAAISQYDNVLQHSADAQDVIEQGRRSENPRFLNTAVNKLENEGWGTYATELAAALTPVRNEFTQLMAGGYKPQEGEAEAYAALFNPAATPNQLEVALKAIGRTGAIRLENINREYAAATNGRNIPGLLTKDSLDAAQHLALDPASMRILNRLDVAGTLMYNPKYGSTPLDTTAIKNQEQQQQAVQSTIPKEATQIYRDPKTQQIVGYALNGKFVAVQGAAPAGR